MNGPSPFSLHEMYYRLLADVVVLIHLLFILFVLFGGLLVLRRRRWVWLHLPLVAWAAFVELAGWICPLTPLENWFRELGGSVGYRSSFVEYYLVPIIYPSSLTRPLQVGLGMLVLVLNLGIYGWAWRQAGQKERPSELNHS